jgi:predicted Zn finger-like uncharacterized protein
MIVQCDQCNAKFKLDDAKIKEGGVKVRCSKCKHIFVVEKETPAEETDFDSVLSGLETSSSAGVQSPDTEAAPETTAASFSPPVGQEPPASEPFQDFGEPDQPSPEEEPAAGEGAAPEESWQMEWGDVPATAGEQGEEPFPSLGEAPGMEPSPPEPAPETHTPEETEFSFGEFSFDEPETAAPAPTPPLEPQAPEAVAEMPEPVATPGESFPSFGDFDTTEGTGAHGEKGSTETPAEEFSFPDDFFAEHREEKPAAVPEPAFPAAEAETAAVIPPVETTDMGIEAAPAEPEPFDFGSFDFGAPTAEEAVVPEKGKEPQKEPEIFFAATGIAQTLPAVAEEMPPLVAEEPVAPSAPARRRGTPSLPFAALVLCIVLILALVGGGYFFFTEGPAAFDKIGLGFLAKWAGIETTEEGNVAINNPTGTYLANKEAGELFAVTGEAVNRFKKPRASIQIKATLYGPKGEVLQQKTAYAGNALSREQLATLPFAKLEERMNNQFGDSLANLGVQPGKSIPFVVVFANVPKEAADYGVEVVGSTVAGQQ